MYGFTALGGFNTSSKTASADTAFAQLIPPYRGTGRGQPFLYKLSNGLPNWYNQAYTHITQLVYNCGSTAHDVVVMRPFNWAVVNGDTAANSAVVNLLTDPGAYSTAYKYSLGADAGGVIANTANNGIAASDYVAYQLRDGTWVMATVSSVSTLAVTLAAATPNVTGGGIEDGTILFFYGVAANTDPATGLAHTYCSAKASTLANLINPNGGGFASIPSLHPGDPLIVYSANATAAGILVTASGFYGTR